MAEHVEPGGFVKRLVKDIIIEAFKSRFNGNHKSHPDLPVYGQLADVRAEMRGLVVSWDDLVIKPANIGDEDVYWWDMSVGVQDQDISEFKYKEQYRSDNYLFDGRLTLSVAARDTMDRDGICDAVTVVLLQDTAFKSDVEGAGVEYESKHTWTGDNAGAMPEGSDDLLHTESMSMEVSGEVWCRRDPVLNVVEAIGLVPYIFGQPDPMPGYDWVPPQGMS